MTYEVWDLDNDTSRISDDIDEAYRMQDAIAELGHRSALVQWDEETNTSKLLDIK